MNLELLYTKIRQPETLSKEDIAPLKELCLKHPYSQLFDMLYLKALANNKDLHFEDELKNHAFKITDRSKLFDLIHTNQEEENVIVSTPKIKEVEAIEPTKEIPQLVEQETELIIIETTTDETTSNETPTEINEVEVIQEVEPKIDISAKQENETVVEEQTLEAKEISEEISLKSSEIELSEPETNTNIEEIKVIPDEIEEISEVEPEIALTSIETETPKIHELEQEILAQIVANTYTLELEIQEEKFKEELEKIDSKEKKEEIVQKRSFSSWLKVTSSSNSDFSENKIEIKDTLNKETNSKAAIKEQKDIETKEETQKTQKESPTEKEIISKFLAEEPKKIKIKTEFFSPLKTAKESVNDENLIYSETLANIYAMQGNYPKAILAFNQLILTNPEKKLYFAKKIEELNKKINS